MVELTGATSDVPSETDKTSENSVTDEENNTKTKTISGAPEAVTSEGGSAVPDTSRDCSLDIGTTQKLKVTHFESPREVYFMRSADKESFSKFYCRIHKEAERLECQEDFRPAAGSLVLVRASDGIWYRGKVLASEDPSHLLFYSVDFGFTEKVQRKQVRDIPATLGSLKTQHYFGKIF